MLGRTLTILALVLALSIATPLLADEPIWDGNTVNLEAQKLADGVYAVIPTSAREMALKGLPIATTGGFVIGDKGVLVIDSMLNQRLANQLINLIKAETDKPLRYLVNTGYHGDHSYGNYVFPGEVTIIQHVNTKLYIDKHFKQDTEFMMQHFGAGRGIEEVVPRTGDILLAEKGEMVLDLGGQEIVIRDFGFAQTGGDLFVWHPVAKVLWTGNPIISTKPALPWLLDGHLVDTLNTLTKVYEVIPADTRIVPGHGPVSDRSAIKWHMDYLTAVRDHVQTAVTEGLSLEQTVEKVKLPEYSGYALFGWVHPSLNIPAAYKDLSKEN